MQDYKNYADYYQSYAVEKRPLLLEYVSFESNYLFMIDGLKREYNIKSLQLTLNSILKVKKES